MIHDLIMAAAAASSSSGIKGYFGGFYNPTSPYIAKYDLITKISSRLTAQLSINKYYVAGGNSTTNGYFIGGRNAQTLAYLSEAEKLSFSNESITVINNALTAGDIQHSGVSSSTSAYIFGGVVDQTIVRKMVFSSETGSNIASGLGQIPTMVGTAYSETRGYWAGGSTYTQQIGRLIYSDETVAIITATLSPPGRRQLAGTQSPTRGYWAGGWDNTQVVSVIDGLNFSDETAYDCTSTLSYATMGQGGGVNDTIVGVWTGGSIHVQDIHEIAFSTDAVTLYSSKIPDGGYYAGGVKTS